MGRKTNELQQGQDKGDLFCLVQWLFAFQMSKVSDAGQFAG